MSGKCVGTDPTGAVGSHIVQSQCGSSPGQHWARELVPNGYILRSATNRLCLDVPGGPVANDAKPIAWACNGSINQT
jgi:Ricin-type beta-trefoil lectin domain-like